MPNNNTSPSPPNHQTVNERINKFIEKFLIWILGVVVSVGIAGWNKMDTQITVLEDRVSFLYQDKVGRQELKDELALVRGQIERSSIDMNIKQEQLRSDILGRLDLILKFTPTRKAGDN